MDNSTHVKFSIEDRSYIALTKKEIHTICAGAGFTGKKLAEIDIVISELTSNIVKHALRGEILVRIIGPHLNEGLEIISIDSGPGIKDPEAMMRDGYSTTNTLGNGLGAIKRMCNLINIYSLPNWGTIILCRIYKTEPSILKKSTFPDIGYIVVPKAGETFCGDGFYAKKTGIYFQMVAADGLGHGPEAHFAVSTLCEEFRKNNDLSPVEIIRSLHAAVKKTRGAVATIIVYNTENKILKIAGVGNISSKFFGNISKSNLSYNGIVGSNIPHTLNDQAIPLETPQLMALYSDGIKTGWDYLKYPKILKHDLTVLASAIYKDNTRNNDDASVIILRFK
jgi:anti-sigma regulatory factor (Ser/Thr protein kinase)